MLFMSVSVNLVLTHHPERSMSHVFFFPSHVLSHSLVLLPPQVVSAFIFTFVGVLAVML